MSLKYIAEAIGSAIIYQGRGGDGKGWMNKLKQLHIYRTGDMTITDGLSKIMKFQDGVDVSHLHFEEVSSTGTDHLSHEERLKYLVDGIILHLEKKGKGSRDWRSRLRITANTQNFDAIRLRDGGLQRRVTIIKISDKMAPHNPESGVDPNTELEEEKKRYNAQMALEFEYGADRGGNAERNASALYGLALLSDVDREKARWNYRTDAFYEAVQSAEDGGKRFINEFLRGYFPEIIPQTIKGEKVVSHKILHSRYIKLCEENKDYGKPCPINKFGPKYIGSKLKLYRDGKDVKVDGRVGKFYCWPDIQVVNDEVSDEAKKQQEKFSNPM